MVGAGVAGLLAARVLADEFAEVAVLDRDPLPDGSIARRGVPQARQIHVLWEAGRATLEDLFPGFTEELLAAGGVAIDARADLHNYSRGDYLAPGSDPLTLYAATRPLYEGVIRRRVADLDGVRLRGGCQFRDYRFDAGAVTGVAIRDRDGERATLSADLAVDATGRTSRTPTLLEERGYAPPPVDEVRIDVGYSTTFVDRPADDRRMIGVLAEAPRTRGGAALPVEGDRWLVNLHGLHGDYPPADPEGVAAFAATLPTPVLARLLDDRRRTTEEVHQYRLPSNRRNRYEDLDRFPEGLVVVGDAIASFNPIYGQGMSVAALEALVLHRALASGDRERIGPRFFDRAGPIVDTAWSMAIGADFAFPQTTGEKPRGTGFLNWYLSRLFRKAHADGALTDAFNRVLTMQQPPSSLLRPAIAWRVLRPSLRLTRSSTRDPAPDRTARADRDGGRASTTREADAPTGDEG